MKRFLWSLLFLTVSLFLQGCSLTYLAHVTTGQLRILEKKEAIQDVIRQKKLPPEKISKLRLIEDIRKFAFQQLGLSENKNYTEYVELDRDVVAFNLVVCPKDSLIPHSWWFPFAGRLSYLGFFNKHYALELQKEYDEEGYDTYLRGTSAYSTLGWFDDPVFSTMLAYSEEMLTNLILHELTHATIYKSGQTEFNEGAATFIGNRGAIAFLITKYGRNSFQHLEAVKGQHDDVIFSQFLRRAREKLKRYYEQPVSRAAKIQRREKLFEDIKTEFRKIRAGFKTEAYAYFEGLPLNNAVIAGFGQYYHDLELFEKVWLRQNKDFKKTVKILKQAETREDPFEYLRMILTHKA